LEGGLKVAELSEDFVDNKMLIEALNINPELPDIQKKKLQDIIIKNQKAFVDGQLQCWKSQIGMSNHLGQKCYSSPTLSYCGVKSREIEC
jgi:hypothetical protein